VRRPLYLPTADARLVALDKDTSAVCDGFGDGGAIDLWEGMPHTQDGF